jgi:hypothetical protein
MVDYSTYDGQYAIGFTLGFTPAGGGGGTSITGLLEQEVPGREFNDATIEPVNGAGAGIQSGIPGFVKQSDCPGKYTYKKAMHGLMEGIWGVRGTFLLTLPTGETYSGAGYLAKVRTAKLDANVMTDEILLKIDGGWVWAANAGAVASQFSIGTGTINLTATPDAKDGTGKRVQVITLANPVGNANAITIAKGAVNGCDNLGAAFSITLAPGAQTTITTCGEGAVIGGANEALDVTATGAQKLGVTIVMY